jgi:6-phosphogluconolactonase
MKTLFAKSLIFFLFITGCSGNRNIEEFYVGTYTSEGAEGIYLCSFNTVTGDITLTETFKGFDNPTFLKISPDKKYLYVVTRALKPGDNNDGAVEAYDISEEGKITLLNKQGTNGSGPCHVDVSSDGSMVAVANYGSGTTSLFPVNKDGSLGKATSTIINEGSGPVQSRQAAPHAHSIKFSETGEYIFSADLGTDRLNIYKLENKKMVPYSQEYFKVTPGSGPRHFDFHQSKDVIYIINELNSTITVIKKNNQTWEEIQTITTLPPDFNESNYCADIHVSSDGRYLYGSNRGHNSIAVYDIDPKTQMLQWKGYVPSQGQWPRNFTLSPDGKYLLAANQRSGNITVFKIENKTGMPQYTGKEIKLPAPVCLEFK